ncbi:MAG: hypothetical protein JHD15_22435 [Phenylobacterium sp.]|uniref:hypothetical protein n=1 Tax=Phenylobacterium sp. TaxID=1871053 RepID=UPI001A1ECF21|nr:hypothetical protein [Phenylobacterium sp.]MBJ7413095.1 hypothetical protein [Phenylobacterium sp.]
MAPRTPTQRPLIALATLLVALVVGLQGAVATITGVTHAAAEREVIVATPSPTAAERPVTTAAPTADHDLATSNAGPGALHGAPAGPHHHHGDLTPAAASAPVQLVRNPQAYSTARFWDHPPRLRAIPSPGMKRPPRVQFPRTA